MMKDAAMQNNTPDGTVELPLVDAHTRLELMLAKYAPWVCRSDWPTRTVRRVLERLLRYQQTLDIVRLYDTLPAKMICEDMERRVAQKVCVWGQEHIPASGPALIVANHPTAADGFVLSAIVGAQRRDTFFFSISDILNVFPGLSPLIVPVGRQSERRTHTQKRAVVRYLDQAIAAKRIGIIFPSGKLAQRRGLCLWERPWISTAVMIARKFDIPLIPANIQARNSELFYLFEALHLTLRNITLIHEMLNLGNQPFHVRFGPPICAHSLPSDANDAIVALQRHTLALSHSDAAEDGQRSGRLPWRRFLPAASGNPAYPLSLSPHLPPGG